jgi:hypothetical protein
MNVGIYNNSPPDNTVPPWLLLCTCNTPRCHCNARFKPDLLCVWGIPYQHPPPTTPTSSITIQFIEFTFCNDRFPLDAISRKINKYASLIHAIQARGWQVAPLMVLTAGARATTHISTMTLLHDTLHIPKLTIQQTCTNINIIAIHHAMSILLYKRKLENNQPLPITHNHP